MRFSEPENFLTEFAPKFCKCPVHKMESASSEELADLTSKKTKPAEMKHSEKTAEEGEAFVKKIMNDLTAREEGLTDAEVEERRETFGLNALPKKKGIHTIITTHNTRTQKKTTIRFVMNGNKY